MQKKPYRRRVLYCAGFIGSFKVCFEHSIDVYRDAMRTYNFTKNDESLSDHLQYAIEFTDRELKAIDRDLRECKDTEDRAAALAIFEHIRQIIPRIFVKDPAKHAEAIHELRSYWGNIEASLSLLTLEYKNPKPINRR